MVVNTCECLAVLNWAVGYGKQYVHSVRFSSCCAVFVPEKCYQVSITRRL